MSSNRNLVLAALLVVVALVVAAQQQPSTPPQAQKRPMQNPIPDTFTNLQVLPKDIAKADLVQIMKGFCVTFEKRCSYCHVATDDLSQADFASDEKETKKKARELLHFILEAQKKPTPTP